jgi:N-acetylglutamate synthase-like GNAT family acetyltransferase
MEVRRPESEHDWAAYFNLRWQMLRAPWNQPRGSERDPLEDVSEHALICDEQGNALAVGRLHFNSPEEGQIRFMAAAPHARGQGLGRCIVAHLEAIARAKGAKTIILYARDSAESFYAKLGYAVVGPGPTLFDAIPHVKMCKRL